MKNKIAVFIFLAAIIASPAFAQQEKKDAIKVIDKIVGTWKIQTMQTGTQEIKNPTSGQWIEFRSDGKYVDNSTAPDSGSYRIDENQSIVYLESSVHTSPKQKSKHEVREWQVGFPEEKQNDAMTMMRLDKKHSSDTVKYVYQRTGPGSGK